jgi:NAD(P)-dependent dehydrogenase (short-subunit alcohol dehydrogenase family)
MARKIVIYGGSGGIGSTTARVLHARGDHVHLVGRSEERLADVAAELGAGFTTGDVSDGSLCSRVAQEAEGPWDGLVYALGTINLRSLQRLTEADFLNDFRVNAIAPSLTRTPLAKGILSTEQAAASIAGMHAMRRLGTSDDMAALSAFLLSPDADWITGQIISVDGGRSTLRTKN